MGAPLTLESISVGLSMISAGFCAWPGLGLAAPALSHVQTLGSAAIRNLFWRAHEESLQQSPDTLCDFIALAHIAISDCVSCIVKHEGETIQTVSQAHGAILYDLWFSGAVPSSR